ncbi:MAG TPA: T9SS type A sorting domain-containing protein [Bacteroidota bacterium]|nr:T9SS type A sorting domain-containing protein [Bacteroidota bacterium]
MGRTMRVRILVLLLWLCGATTHAQGYLPLQVGDRWDYGEIDYHTPGQLYYLYTVRIVADTTMPNGRVYAIQQGDFGTHFLRQEGSRVYTFTADTEAVLYDFALAQGDTVTMSRRDTFYTIVTVDPGQSQIFGRTWKTWNFVKTTNTNTDGGSRVTIADSLARTYIFIDPGYTDYLMGAVIDGKLYGTVTHLGVEIETAPTGFRLSQNFPNPFNPTTTIRYALPQRVHVTLTVFNTLGQHIATLVDAVKEPGEHSIRFDAGGLSSGVYYYRLQAGGFVGAKKAFLLK